MAGIECLAGMTQVGSSPAQGLGAQVPRLAAGVALHRKPAVTSSGFPGPSLFPRPKKGAPTSTNRTAGPYTPIRGHQSKAI